RDVEERAGRPRLAREPAATLAQPLRESGQDVVLARQVRAVEEALLRDEEEQERRAERLEAAQGRDREAALGDEEHLVPEAGARRDDEPAPDRDQARGHHHERVGGPEGEGLLTAGG